MTTKEPYGDVRDDWYARTSKMTLDDLPAFLKEISEHPHDYSTICYAVAAAALAAARAIDGSPRGGITGFQGGAIMWEFMREWNGVTFPARLLRYENMLYPQYEHDFREINRETADWIKAEAQKKLDDPTNGSAHPDVIEHWKRVARGWVPFGFIVSGAA